MNKKLMTALKQLHLENNRLTDDAIIAELVSAYYIIESKHGYRLTDYGALKLAQWLATNPTVLEIE